MDKERACEQGLCTSCEMPLRQAELEADARKCGVCRAVANRRKAMKREVDRSPQEIDASYGKRIAEEQALRHREGLPAGGRTGRDREHDRRRRARGPGTRRGR